MRKTAIILVGALAVALPAVAGSEADGGQRLAAVSHVVVREQQRPQPRVLVQRRDAREEHSETERKTVRLGNNGELDISNITGNIEIRRGGGGEATIEIVKVARARTVDEAKELLPLVKVEMSERANRVEVRTLYPAHQHNFNRRNINVQVHYTISAPAGTRVRAHSISGHVRAAEITGELSLTTTSGDVQIIKGKRVSTAKTTSGTVTISDTDSDTPISAESISGDVRVQRVKASRMELSTVSGNVMVQDVTCDRLEATTVSGNVDFGSPIVKGGRYELNSHSGNVRLAVAGNNGYEVEANSFSGSVHSDVAMAGGGIQTAGRGPRRKELKGVVGDGSAMVEITTFSGNVHIMKR